MIAGSAISLICVVYFVVKRFRSRKNVPYVAMNSIDSNSGEDLQTAIQNSLSENYKTPSFAFVPPHLQGYVPNKNQPEYGIPMFQPQSH